MSQEYKIPLSEEGVHKLNETTGHFIQASHAFHADQGATKIACGFAAVGSTISMPFIRSLKVATAMFSLMVVNNLLLLRIKTPSEFSREDALKMAGDVAEGGTHVAKGMVSFASFIYNDGFGFACNTANHFLATGKAKLARGAEEVRKVALTTEEEKDEVQVVETVVLSPEVQKEAEKMLADNIVVVTSPPQELQKMEASLTKTADHFLGASNGAITPIEQDLVNTENLPGDLSEANDAVIATGA